MISLAQAFAQWQELAVNIPKDDGPALAESWNDYTDSLCKDGELCELQYHYAPAYDDAMPGPGRQYDALADDREFILDAMNITMRAAFVPFSQSRNKGQKEPSLNWRVTLFKDGKEVISTDYMQGCGYCPAYKNPATFPGSKKRDEHTTRENIKRECETGRISRAYTSLGLVSDAKIPPPSVSEVLNSLLLDGSAIDCRDFDDWCSDFGADSDSIKARETYDACIAIGLKLRGTFGNSALENLRELFGDC